MLHTMLIEQNLLQDELYVTARQLNIYTVYITDIYYLPSIKF